MLSAYLYDEEPIRIRVDRDSGMMDQSGWRGLSPIDPSPWCSTPSRFFQYLEVRIGGLDGRPALLY